MVCGGGEDVDWLLFNKNSIEKEEDLTSNEANELIEAIDKAKKEWVNTQLVFNWVEEPELVDYAVYAMEAAERRYIYLLNKAKKLGVVIKPT
jgi:hypothetical protein